MRHFLVIASNFIIAVVIAVSVVNYANKQHLSSVEAAEQAFVNAAGVVSGIADNYLEDTQIICDGWAKYINAREMTMEEAVQYLRDTKTIDSVSAHIIWRDSFQGLSIEDRVSEPGNYRVDYSKRLRGIFRDITEGNSITITARYNDPMTGEYVLSFCRKIFLLDESGQKKEAILLRLVPVSYLQEQWVFPSIYEGADVALIKKDGEYILKPNSMKNESFFSYIYSYNRGVIDQKVLADRVATEDFGYFYGKDAEERDCIWVFRSLKKEDRWSVVVTLPRENIQGVPTDWFIAGTIIFGLVLILIVDCSYFLFLIHGKRIIQRQLEEQAGELQSALKSERENKSIVQGISREYNSLWIVEEMGKKITLVQENAGDKDEFQEILKKTVRKYPSYMKIMTEYANRFVCEEDRAYFLEACDYDHVKAQIRENNIFLVTFRRIIHGKIEYYQLSFTATDRDTAFVIGFRDIHAAMEEKQRQADDLARALALAEHASNAKTVFLSNMSHDIRTPLNAIMGFTALASAHMEDKEQLRDYLSKISLSGEHLLSLINDVLDMSRIESGKVKVEAKEMHLPDLFHELQAMIQTNIEEKQLKLFMDTVDVFHEDVIADKLKLSQILLNIVGNAIKFTKPGGSIVIRIIEKTGAPEGCASFQFLVKDTGIGMTKEFMEHIFEPFTREETSTVSGIQGSGLGMAITKNIVDMMGGSIQVTSEVDKGTEFTVDLVFPIQENSAEAAPVSTLQGLHALVADSDFRTCASLTKMLKDMGLRAEWTTTGEEAVLRARLAAEYGSFFQVYLISWTMDDTDVLELIRQIRQYDGEGEAVVILTGYEWGSIREAALEAGVTGFCAKPVFFSELQQALTAPGQQQDAEDRRLTEQFAGKHILLVEDNALNQEIAMELLQTAGFLVDVAEDGAVAVEKMKGKDASRYDLILMDIQMPNMDGYESTRQIRSLADRQAAQIPIIAMTANAFEEDKRMALEAGMNGHISKPVDVDRLLEVLGEVLG